MAALFGHLKFVTDAALKREDEKAADLALWMGNYLHQIGDYPVARPYAERALAIREKRLGPEHPNTRIVRDNLAGLERG